MKRFCFALFLCALATTAVEAQQTAATSASDGKDQLASIDGVVTGAGGQPLRKTTVTLRSMSGPGVIGVVSGPGQQPSGFAATSDTEGKFHFENLPPGVYNLSGNHAGYLPTNYGAKRWLGPGTALTLTAGKTISGLKFEMLQACVISGKVLDEDGDPIPQALVRMYQPMYRNGKKQLMPTNIRSTDSNGEFRLDSTPPGRFLIAAGKRPAYPGDIPVRNGSLKPGEQEQDYVTTYYPGTTEQSAAQPVTVAAGQEFAGINITLKKMPVFHVRGRVTGAIPGKPLSSLRVMASELSANGITLVSGMGNGNIGRDGTFDLGTLPPGGYSVSVTNMTGMFQAFARQSIQVGNQDLDDVTIALQPLGEVVGSVQIEGDEAATTPGQNPAPTPQMRIMLSSGESMPMNVPPQSVKEDGTFSFADVSPGKYRVIVIGTPPGSYVSSIRAGGQDAQTGGFEINSGQVKLDVRLSRNAGQITGSVTDGQNATPGAIVTLIPDPSNPELTWLYRQTTADQSGNFKLTGIAPGKYRVYAWEDLEPGANQDPDLAKAWAGKSAEITVKEKSQETATLVRISKAEMESTPR